MRSTRPRSSSLIVACATLLVGCAGDPEPQPPAEPAATTATPPPAAAAPPADTLPEIGPSAHDPWPRYRRAKWFEEHGDFEQAIAEYGACINLLPAHNATRPVLDLGKLHQRLGHSQPAERCFREVLDTYPTDPATYRTNPDFRDAAVGLSAILAPRGADLERTSLRDRFLGELHGTAEAWAAGATWTKTPLPAATPAPAPAPAPAPPPARR